MTSIQGPSLYHLSRNWKLYIFVLLFTAGAGLYMFDQPEHNSCLEGTLIRASEGSSLIPDQTTMIARLDNGTQIKLKNLLGVMPVAGRRVVIEKKTRPIVGFSEYVFVRFVD